MKNLKTKVLNFPEKPGVYIMKNIAGEIIYIGKATSLKERVRSYFSSNIAPKTIQQMLEVTDIEYQLTESAFEALVLESNLIKKYFPKYNIREKDDKSRSYIYITNESFPRIYILRASDLAKEKYLNKNLFGPFGSGHVVGQALDVIREIVPFRTCRIMPKKKCLYGRLGLCEAPCEGKIAKDDYNKNIKSIKNFLSGKKEKVLNQFKRDLKFYSKNLEFEKAAEIRDRIFALEHLKKVHVVSDSNATVYDRIEGYDISNIFGEYATGSMVVFINGESEKSEYRKFKIKTVKGANDVAMMKEVLERRFRNNWPYPDLILIDGGRPQVNAALEVLKERGLNIPIVGLAKGPDRKKDEIVASKTFPRDEISLLKQVRDEAHRFAKGYYEKLHRRGLLSDFTDKAR